MIEFNMPSLGADMEAGTLREWLVKPGDKVKRGDIIAVVETQKGLIDIEVFDEGIIDQLLIGQDEKVPVGKVMALIANGASPKTPVLPQVKASPLAKRMAAEKGIDLQTIIGTGEGGAITKEDVEKAAGQKRVVTEIKPPASESIRMAVAAAMSKSNREIPHYYLQQKIDMRRALTWLSEANKLRNVKQRLLPVVLLVKSVAAALVAVPQLNGFWENGFQQMNEINIGFAISLRSGGVMIPAIRNADKKSLDELMAALNDIIPRARAMKLRSSELSSSTITITSLGEANAELVYGVIYPPQVALVGFGSIIEQPWAEQGMLDVRPVITATVAADHRATDGTTGSRLLMHINNQLQKPELL
ncbi:branched-chain alpha-keto acid dehydrogenase subunit E2 [Niastella koreensis]|uniref:Dihydrolipoamide acetyltransferase component of pyruvate dehydrogenase complex n=2 Tax=Niastella koreensis TaxID=354356 RepID=G8TJ99_NIAKG|nr:dihydrolipoamide acetyltransferase family protein [Niastella koreensis]AEV98632.1 Dihydrolipoyllysine-residue acetyltransferase [Niastella koreensis GR20-10]OQP52925.1 branched-chain alpha-keto acid dehydrogenase subunit E2 [Niastella koreensis]